MTVISTKSSTITTQSAATTTTSGTQVIREVIVRPPAPKLLKNKALLCKPIMQTKGISCKPHPCHKAIQTDNLTIDNTDVPSVQNDTIEDDENKSEDNVKSSGKPVIIPIPLPIFVPAPLHMFNRPVPTPMPFPLPIPVPVFIPTTKASSTEILKHIKEIQEKIPSNPYEVDLLMMAEMVAADGQKTPKEESPIKASGDQQDSYNSIDKDLNDFDLKEPSLDFEKTLASPNTKQETSGQEEISSPEKNEPRTRFRNAKRTKSRGGRGRGRKRTRLDGDISVSDAVVEDSVSTPLTTENETVEEPDHCLKHTFGVNAWKHWVLEKNSQLEKGSQSLRKLKLFKTDILQLSPDELNYSLCLFVKEVRKPQGEEYAPDSIYYLCLGIQQYLFENNRIDNIFTDPYYEKFTECLNDVLQKHESINNEVHFISRIEEEILWEAKQLGAHSPHVLLNTLMYFNTKYFFLKTIEDHMQLSFCHIMKHWKKSSSVKEMAKRRREEQPIFEQLENVDNPLRCPVKLYEFYMSKCPESVKTRNDVFYLYPERSCVPDSPVWYSTQPLGRESVTKMLQRIRMVREIHEIDDDQKG